MLERIISNVTSFFQPSQNDERKKLLKKEKATFESLPSDMKKVILSFLSPLDLLSLSKVNKDLKRHIEEKETVYDIEIDKIKLNGTFKQICKELEDLNKKINLKNIRDAKIRQLRSEQSQHQCTSNSSACVAIAMGCGGSVATPGCALTAVLLTPHIGSLYAFLAGTGACLTTVCISSTAIGVFSQISSKEELKVNAIEKEIQKEMKEPITFTMRR